MSALILNGSLVFTSVTLVEKIITASEFLRYYRGKRATQMSMNPLILLNNVNTP
jgi:hypothetical protein